MGANKALAAWLLVMSASAWTFAQDLTTPSGQSFSGQSFSGQSLPDSSGPASSQSDQADKPEKNESSSRHSSHHVRVPVEDEDSEPAELKDAEAAIDKKDYAAAQSFLHKLIEKQPQSYVAWFDLGFVDNALGNVNDSILAYRKSVAAKPDVFESNLNLGLQLAKTGQLDAEKFLRAATQLKPTSQVAEGQYRAWMALAQVIEKSKPEEALDAYQHAATLRPQEAEPHLSMGQILEQQNKFSDAAGEYKQALALDQHSSDAAVALANIFMRAHQFPQAEESLRKVLTEQPNSGPAHIQLGRVLAAEGKTDAALVELKRGTELSPSDEDAQRDLASVYTTANKDAEAETTYRRLVAAHSTDAELHRELAEALLKEKKFPEAQQEFATAVKLKPNLGDAYSGLAFAAGENKDYALVIRVLDVRAKLLPETAITFFMRASAYDHLRDFKNAAANYHLFLNSARGKYPDQEWQAKHRLIAIEPKK